MEKVPFFLHDLGKPEVDAVAQVLAGPLLTTGETVAQFERRFAAYLGAKHALGLTSCTGGLHMSLLALDIGPGHEVITTPMTFIATSTAICSAGAKPVFVDVEPTTGNIDVTKIEAAITPRTKAIMPVHLYGQMCDMRAMRAIADKHGLAIIEDAAHCIEGERDGVKPGQLGDTACFSFYATKNLTCGEGGAVTCNSAELHEKLKLLRLHGMNKMAADRAKEGYQHWDMLSLGWKYNMDNIQAALLLPQMDRLDAKWEKRAILAKLYEDGLKKLPAVSRPKTLPGVKHAWHLFPVWVAPERRDSTLAVLKSHNVDAMVNYRAIHQLTYFKETLGYSLDSFPVANQIGNSTISVPFYPQMPHEHVARVCDALKAAS